MLSDRETEVKPADLDLPQTMLVKINIGQGGVDCIGQLTAISEGFLTFEALRMLIYQPMDDGRVKVQSFMYFLIPAGDRSLDIRDSAIITMCPCPENFARQYKQATSAIQIAQPQDISRALTRRG